MLGLAAAAVAAAAYVGSTPQQNTLSGDPPLPAARADFVREFKGLAPQPHGIATHRFRKPGFDWRLQGPTNVQGGQRHELVENFEIHQQNAAPRFRVGVRRDGENSGVGYRRVLGPKAAAKLKNLLADLRAKDPPFFGTGIGTDRVYRFEANRMPRIDPGTLIDRRAKHWNAVPNEFVG